MASIREYSMKILLNSKCFNEKKNSERYRTWYARYVGHGAIDQTPCGLVTHLSVSELDGYWLMKEIGFKGFKDSKTFIWQRKYMHLDNNPSIFHFVRSKPISYNIHWGKHCGHWTLICQLHREWQSMLYSINAFRIDINATSGDPY